MTSQNLTENKLQYETFELKLAALLLSEVPHSSFEVYEKENSLRKIIKVKYPQAYKNQVLKIEKDFINKIASANVYLYNRSLNLIRDRLRGKTGEFINNERPRELVK